MKVPSFWYKEGDGADFHDKDKGLLLALVSGFKEINDMKNMVMKKQWVEDGNDRLLPSMQLATIVRSEYIREMPKLLKGCGWLNRLAIQRLVDFLLVVYKNDDMYYERMGYLMGRFIERAPEWKTSDKATRQKILNEERVLYFTHEKREDRIVFLTRGWDFLEKQYGEDEGIERSVNFGIERLYAHKELFSWEEVSRLGLTAFHPEHWYPNGRGQMWNMVHAGAG